MDGEPNAFAYLSLFLWVPVTLVLFHWLRPPVAAMVSILGGMMLLPEQTVVDLPLLPPMDKSSLTPFGALLGCMWKAPERLRAARPLRGIDRLYLLVLIGNIGTALTNAEPIVTGPVIRPGLTLYDAFALCVKDVLSLYLPFLIGRAMVRTSRDLADLMRVLVWSGILYGLLALVEVRLSPQLHRWLYGFHQLDFSMTLRYGGYRPTVFMLTGMATAMFIMSTSLAAWTRWRAGSSSPAPAVFLSIVLVLCKSTGALVYAFAVVPVVVAVRRPRMWLPAGLVTMVILFPALRGADVFPTDTLVEAAETINHERALSLWFRFDQEDQLLERARERVLFGWGMYNRNRVFDLETGSDLSVTDGDWIIQVGTRGLVGFVGLYGAFALAILLAQRRFDHIAKRRDRILLAGLATISALLIVDLLPNGLFHDLPIFLAGTVAGASTGIADATKRARRRAKREERAQANRQGAGGDRAPVPRGRRPGRRLPRDDRQSVGWRSQERAQATAQAVAPAGE